MQCASHTEKKKKGGGWDRIRKQLMRIFFVIIIPASIFSYLGDPVNVVPCLFP